MKSRYLAQVLPRVDDRRQLVLITGARQTGKTTLVKTHYSALEYYNFDAPEIREQFEQLASAHFHQVGNAILDEVQKCPSVFEKLKYAFDAGDIDFSCLLGSSQVLMLKKIRESLAGRVRLHELYPLMPVEMIATSRITPPLLNDVLLETDIDAYLAKCPNTLLGKTALSYEQSIDALYAWGGMPSLLSLDDPEKQKWLSDYCYTFLQRDLADLARINDLEPFARFQKIAAARCSGLINYADLARDSGVSSDTARRYLEYLHVSYQTFLLPPYYENITNTVVKSPRLYFVDMGVCRHLCNMFGSDTGALFESFVVSEIYKWIQTSQLMVEMYFYRTRDGMEVDLLLKDSRGFIGIEIKSRKSVHKSDVRHLNVLAEKLGDKWRAGLIVYRGDTLEKLGDKLWAIPVAHLLHGVR